MDTGVLHDVELGFEGIKMTLQQGKKNSDRIILDGSIKGKARPGRMVREHLQKSYQDSIQIFSFDFLLIACNYGPFRLRQIYLDSCLGWSNQGKQ